MKKCKRKICNILVKNVKYKYCSKECYWEYMKGKESSTKGKIFRKLKKCKRVLCENLINSYSNKYCSKKCFSIDRSKNNPAKRKEVRGKISETTKSNYEKGKVVAWNKGLKNIYSEETINKIKEARAKQVFSKESKEKRIQSMKNFWANEENKKKMIDNNSILQKNKILTQEHRLKIGKGNEGKVHSEEQNLKMSKIRKQQWRDSDYVKKQMESRNVYPNKTELYLQSFLDNIFFEGQFIYVGDGKEIIGGKCPDFIDPINNKIIELYGDYWHRNDDPNDRINYFKDYGYNTLVIWESELKDINNLKKKLEAFIYG